MKKMILILLALALGAFAQGKEKVAVYMTGKNQTSVVALALTDAISDSENFTAIESTKSFLNTIKKENLYQHSGAVDNSQIADIGKKSGARYVCVAELTNLSEAISGSKESLLTARLIDVESATIAASAYQIAEITDNKSMLPISRNLAKALLRNFEEKDKNAEKDVAAIYLASEDNSGIDGVLQSLLIDAVANSKEYVASERTNVFLEQLSVELGRQYSGEVDNNQLQKLGFQSGAKYVVVLRTDSEIVHIRIIDVESGDILKGKSKTDVLETSDMRKLRQSLSKLTGQIFTRDIFGSVSYNGQTYKTVKMPDGKEWFAENLNYAASDSKCYDNSANCAKYGRLYNWARAKQVCPSGWHLPSDAEWNALMTAVGGASTAGTELKANSGWNNNGNGTDEYGFSALPGGGFGGSSGGFFYVGISGLWWSSTEKDAGDAWLRYMDSSGASVGRSIHDKSIYFSVRCVKD